MNNQTNTASITIDELWKVMGGEDTKPNKQKELLEKMRKKKEHMDSIFPKPDLKHIFF